MGGDIPWAVAAGMAASEIREMEAEAEECRVAQYPRSSDDSSGVISEEAESSSPFFSCVANQAFANVDVGGGVEDCGGGSREQVDMDDIALDEFVQPVRQQPVKLASFAQNPRVQTTSYICKLKMPRVSEEQPKAQMEPPRKKNKRDDVTGSTTEEDEPSSEGFEPVVRPPKQPRPGMPDTSGVGDCYKPKHRRCHVEEDINVGVPNGQPEWETRMAATEAVDDDTRAGVQPVRVGQPCVVGAAAKRETYGALTAVDVSPVAFRLGKHERPDINNDFMFDTRWKAHGRIQIVDDDIEPVSTVNAGSSDNSGNAIRSVDSAQSDEATSAIEPIACRRIKIRTNTKPTNASKKLSDTEGTHAEMTFGNCHEKPAQPEDVAQEASPVIVNSENERTLKNAVSSRMLSCSRKHK